MDVPSYLENMICFLVQHIQTFHPPICREPRCLRRNFQEEKNFWWNDPSFLAPIELHRSQQASHFCNATERPSGDQSPPLCVPYLTCRRDKANKGRDPKQGGISVHYGMTVYRIRWPDLQSEHALYFTNLSLEVPGVAFQIIEMTYHFLKPVITIILKTTV